MANYIEDYLDEHPEADWTEAYDAWCKDGDQAYAEYVADRVDRASHQAKDNRI